MLQCQLVLFQAENTSDSSAISFQIYALHFRILTITREIYVLVAGRLYFLQVPRHCPANSKEKSVKTSGALVK